MRFRQIEHLLFALSKPEPVNSTAAYGDERLDYLKSLVARIFPRVEKSLQPLPSIRNHHKLDVCDGKSGQHAGGEIASGHARYQKHHGRYHRDNHGRYEILTEQNECGGYSDYDNAGNERPFNVCNFVDPLLKVVSEKHYHCDLCKLRRLKRKDTDANKSMRPFRRGQKEHKRKHAQTE